MAIQLNRPGQAMTASQRAAEQKINPYAGAGPARTDAAGRQALVDKQRASTAQAAEANRQRVAGRAAARAASRGSDSPPVGAGGTVFNQGVTPHPGGRRPLFNGTTQTPIKAQPGTGGGIQIHPPAQGGMAKGGKIDGCAKRGKTRGKMI
jgi:hypothetical protein